MEQAAAAAWSLVVALLVYLIAVLPVGLPPWVSGLIALGVAFVAALALTALVRRQSRRRSEVEQRQRAADRLRSRPVQRGGDPWAWADQALVNQPMNDLIRAQYDDVGKQRRSEVREALDAANVTKLQE